MKRGVVKLESQAAEVRQNRTGGVEVEIETRDKAQTQYKREKKGRPPPPSLCAQAHLEGPEGVMLFKHTLVVVERTQRTLRLLQKARRRNTEIKTNHLRLQDEAIRQRETESVCLA